ncbi:MAG: hypothetical protein WAM18_07790 [Halobacillus sp.]|uniref:hypothetical protein n=1 Tax=Halobacillus sp. TaxID=56800 RepID=UPI003BB0504F
MGLRMFTCVAVFFVVLFGFYGESSEAAESTSYFVDKEKLPFDAPSGIETDRYWGVHKGAGYRIEVPEKWNGELVLYAHGYRNAEVKELTVDNPENLRKYLLEKGYAWGASSYSTNGYDVKQGVIDTHALGKFFNGKIAKPKRTYIVGHSMGGHITGVLIEQFRNEYDGAMPMCGVMGDNELFDFFADFNLASQVLAGIDPIFPAEENYQTTVVPKIKQAIGLNTGVLTLEGEMLQDLTMYLSGGERPLFDLAFSSWNNFLFTLYRSDFSYGTPGNIIDNTDSIYQLDSNSELSVEEMYLAEKIPEITADPQARNKNGLSKIPRISGELHQPVLTLHTLGDLFVPFSMEQLYAEKVAANGESDLLVSRAVRAVGHCEFTPVEETEAFADLTDWVENGIKPEGDAILDPEVVSQTDFGIKFTNPIRTYDPLLSLNE